MACSAILSNVCEVPCLLVRDDFDVHAMMNPSKFYKPIGKVTRSPKIGVPIGLQNAYRTKQNNKNNNKTKLNG